MIIAFTGHRPPKLGGDYSWVNPLIRAITGEIEEQLFKLKPEKCITGMALGVDHIAAYCCIKHDIPFIAAIPFAEQSKKWPRDSQERYDKLLMQAKEKVIINPGPYASWKMQKRNEWMVDHCDTLIAVWDGSKGGTANCVKYAEKLGRTIIRINPKDLG